MAKVPVRERKGLGKGLNALLSDNHIENSDDSLTYEATEKPKSDDLEINKINTNPFQPRSYFNEKALQELSDSIRIQGIIQPITVRKKENGDYELISGERRLQASKLAGLKTIPAYIRDADDQQMLEMALIENIQRENLNAIEIALSYKKLMDLCKLNQDDLGERVGKERSTVTNYLRLLNLPVEIQEGIREKSISMGHARTILGLLHEKDQISLYRRTLSEGLSVRKLEELVKNFNQPQKSTSQKNSVTEFNRFTHLEKKLSGWFSAKVAIKTDSKNKGEIKIGFQNKEQFELIMNKLRKKQQ